MLRIVFFFLIPLVPKNWDWFASSKWECNMHKSAKSMNGFTICQVYVSQALVNISKDALLIHYMDDLFWANPDAVYFQRLLKNCRRFYIITSDGATR